MITHDLRVSPHRVLRNQRLRGISLWCIHRITHDCRYTGNARSARLLLSLALLYCDCGGAGVRRCPRRREPGGGCTRRGCGQTVPPDDAKFGIFICFPPSACPSPCPTMALAISWRGSALASKRHKAIKWWCVHRAATLSVLALSALATDTNDVSPAGETQATATSLLNTARESSSNSNRPFFIQDPTDGLCLSGGTFKRCAVDTLWKVEGEPGRHSVRRLAVLDDGEITTA